MPTKRLTQTVKSFLQASVKVNTISSGVEIVATHAPAYTGDEFSFEIRSPGGVVDGHIAALQLALAIANAIDIDNLARAFRKERGCSNPELPKLMASLAAKVAAMQVLKMEIDSEGKANGNSTGKASELDAA